MRSFAPTLIVLALTARAEALPVLRLVLSGDARTLAEGGGDPFSRPDLEALKLARPALLADRVAPTVMTRLDSETTVAIDGTHDFSGTRAADTRARTTWVQPYEIAGNQLVFALSGRFEDGTMRVRNERDGVLFDLSERRAATQAGVAWRAASWLRLGGSVGLGLGRAYAIEAVANVGGFELGFVQRAEQLHWGIDTPPGKRKSFSRPAVSYDIDQTRESAVFSATYRHRWVAVRAGWDALQPEDVEVEGDVWVGTHLRLRGRYEAASFAFDDAARSGGETVASVDLGVRHARWTAGADAAFGANHFVVRRMSSTIATASAWEDNGEVTGEQLFSLQADFNLYLRHLYRAQLTQWSGGWSREGQRWSFGLGAQHLEATNPAGGIVYGSASTDQLSGSNEVKAAFAKAFAITGGVGWHLGKTTLRVGAAQLVPYAGREEGNPATTPTTPTPTTTPPAPDPGLSAQISALMKKARTIDGGRLLVLEVDRAF